MDTSAACKARGFLILFSAKLKSCPIKTPFVRMLGIEGDFRNVDPAVLMPGFVRQLG